jgi:peptidyl-prolyl cis-trans isomerase SurA
MNFLSVSIACAAIAATLAGFAGPVAAQEFPAPGRPDDITVLGQSDPRVRKAAAIVNGSVITDLDVDQRLALVVTAAGGRISREEIVRLRGQILRNLIDEKLQVAEAAEHDVKTDEAQVTEAFGRVATNFKQTPEQFDTFLKGVGASRQSLSDQIRAELAWSRLMRRRVEPFVNVGDDEVNAMIKRLEASKGQDEFRMGEIFIPSTEENSEEAKALLGNILTQVRGGASFVTYVRQYSQSATAAFGGDKGWIRLNQLAPELRAAVNDATSAANAAYPLYIGPVRSGSGLYLLSVAERRKVLGADPLDAMVTVKQIAMPLPKDKPRAELEKMVQDFTQKARVMTGCGRAADLAASISGKSSDMPPTKIRDMPRGLHGALVNLQIGQSTPPFGTDDDARVLMLCGRDEAQETAPSFDEVYAQINEERISMMARRYLRDLRRDAIVDYR